MFNIPSAMKHPVCVADIRLILVVITILLRVLTALPFHIALVVPITLTIFRLNIRNFQTVLRRYDNGPLVFFLLCFVLYSRRFELMWWLMLLLSVVVFNSNMLCIFVTCILSLYLSFKIDEHAIFKCLEWML